ncbi:MAG: SH3 domain-containing protein [Clostridia bacterium]|nr:SH3 domain-containing protein [Clostridia bacterium]
MRKHVLKIAALALVLMMIGGAALSEVVTTGSVWLRSAPNLNAEQITSYKEGKSLTFLGETAEDERPVLWYKVTDGKNTGWISSKYSKLVNEELPAPAATEAAVENPVEPIAAPVEPTEAPAPLPEPEGDSEGDSSAATDALNAGKLFVDSIFQKPADNADVVELSGFYMDDLVTAANDIGLIDYREVISEVPFQYYNDAVIIAGNQNVEHVEVFGAGYSVFGVQVGMSTGEAIACLNAAGLDYLPGLNGVTYEHPAGESAGYVDENGHDSCVNLYTDDRNVVIVIDWSTYTG